MNVSVYNPALLQTPNIFCNVSSPTPNSTSSIHFRKNPLRISRGPPLPSLKIQSWRLSAAPCDGPLRVSAHFRQRSRRRRNSLREKKLAAPGDDSQVSNDVAPGSPNPNSPSIPIHLHDQTIDELSSPTKKSDLLDKLDKWVDRYKEDSEFWGVGTAPIFRICEDAHGNVVRVSVNKEEIVKRSRIGGWSVNQEADLKSRISRAEVIAREIEAGKRVIPRNSSIAKFVIEGKKLPLVEALHSIPLRGEKFVKRLPSVAFTVLCGCCVLLVVTSLFTGNGRAELTREEAEMLRRKKKLRKEAAELESGSVKVLDETPELAMGSIRRPQLDRDELMSNILQAKAHKERLLTPDSSTLTNDKDADFAEKVREIREMANRARELEGQNDSRNGEIEEEDDTSSFPLADNGKFINSNNNAPADAEPSTGGSDSDVLPETDFVPALSVENKMATIGNSVNGVKVREDRDPGFVNNNYVNATVNDQETSRDRTIHVDRKTTADDSNPSVVGHLRIKVKDVKNEAVANLPGEKESISSPSISMNNRRMKPKIIRSIKDARKYLTEKNRMSTNDVQTIPEVQYKRLSVGANARNSTDKLNGEIKAGGKAGPSKMDKLHKDDSKIGSFSTEKEDTQIQTERHVKSCYDLSHPKSQEPLGATGGMRAPLDGFGSDMTHPSNMLLQCCEENTEFLNGSRTLKIDNTNSEHENLDDQTRLDSSIGHSKPECHSPVLSSANSSNSTSVKVTPELTKQFGEDRSHPQTCDVLSNKRHSNKEPSVNRSEDEIYSCSITTDEPNINKDQLVKTQSKMIEPLETIKPDLPSLVTKTSGESDFDDGGMPVYHERTTLSRDLDLPTLDTALNDKKNHHGLKDFSSSGTSSQKDSDGSNCLADALTSNTTNNWVEKNFQQFDPIIKKIGAGFQENYMVAKEKVQEQPSLRPEINELGLMEDDGELEWMNDESLRKIVFQVRENELAGRDPFHLMNADDQCAFFEGLERKADKVNEKLLGLHEWVHSRVENLDYGADGISLDDPLEKIIPRWKGSSTERYPEFLQTKFQTGNEGNSNSVMGDAHNNLQKSEESLDSTTSSPYTILKGGRKRSSGGSSTNPKTLVECSDGSSRPGKKNGNEHWQHTKKWSQGFLEVYNAETDPEIKSIMKDIGKDLDRWTTEKEIQDAADLLKKIPRKKRKYIEKKMNKLKEEMKTFGAPAVVSKYKEYLNEKEEDYLWWLDLRFVLCIELYTTEAGNPKVGFYSLEMAADLELNPKQYHVIAFEDPGDSKDFCYILQSHMDMLGSGKSFVVARPPKDCFREAKGNGFSVTVIRKGEIKLNVDQTLEEVEEEIIEVGSKIYHDTIMRERSFDLHSLMKGMISADSNRTSKQKLMKPAGL